LVGYSPEGFIIGPLLHQKRRATHGGSCALAVAVIPRRENHEIYGMKLGVWVIGQAASEG
jgi:hypothetical protein